MCMSPMADHSAAEVSGVSKEFDYDPEIEHLRMYAYYFGFDPTGIFLVDRLLSEIATAGKAYHSTEWWNEKDSEDPTYIDRIQGAATEIAAEIRRLNRLKLLP